jgi:hypothetical protein
MQPAVITIPTMARQIGALILLIGIACIPGYGQGIALGILIVMACSSPAMALQSLAAGTMVICINSSLVGGGGDASVLAVGLKWVLLFVACGRSLLAHVEPTTAHKSLMIYWGVITAILLGNSVFISALPAISVFKTISFALGLLCAIRLALLTSDQGEQMLLFFSEIGIAVFVVSLPMIELGVGHSRNGVGLNGIFSQPQALGIFLVMTGAATFATAFKTPHLERVLIVLGLAQWSMIFLTGARTAFVAIAAGGIVYVIEIVVGGEKESKVKSLSPASVIIAITGVLLVTTAFPGIRDGFTSFFQKGDQQSPISMDNPELALGESSRGGQIFSALEVAEEHPLFGYGFGVDPGSLSNMDANGAQLGGIPLSAPVEQGFLPLATIAQIGILGSLFVLAFLFAIYRLARMHSKETSALFAAVLGVNLGEMIFYSVGGLGMVMWLLLWLFAVSGTIPHRPYAVAAK